MPADKNDRQHTVIKKYANRRLYHTGSSTYVTLEDLAKMVQNGEDFAVYDARSGDDITRSVLTQIIFEQENKAGEDNLLPVAFLRQLIRFYGDSMRIMVPSFLEFSMANFAKDQDGLREKFTENFQNFGPGVLQQALQDQVQANMTFFGDAMKMFMAGFSPSAPKHDKSLQGAKPESSDLSELKKQMTEIQTRLEQLSRK